MLRQPVVAGSFYPGESQVLKSELEEYIRFADTKKKVIGLISPHAGYIYSGGCAGKGFGQVEVPDTVIILGVNHSWGLGHPFAVDDHDHWRTPLGDVEIDNELGEKLVVNSEIFGIDNIASSREHSLEVQVPFIQFINPDAKILPITISSHNIDKLMAGGKEIAQLIKNTTDSDVLMVASTDMSHQIEAGLAKEKDSKAIDKILHLDPQGLLQVVNEENISMCGAAPTTMMLSAALELKAQKAQIIEYTNSGKATGDYSSVVGYLSMMVY
jgi:AmmeMemoRadiSam system protein B